MKNFWFQIRKNLLSCFGLGIIVLLLVAALAGSYLQPYDPVDINPVDRLQAPNMEHLMGTDELGRDIFSRVIAGARISLISGVSIIFVAGVVGVFVGVIGGYFGGWLDLVLMRVTDIFISLPTLILAIAATTALGPNLTNAILAMALVWWPIYARLIRSEVLSVKEQDYVKAMKVAGANHFRIIVFHVLPNSIDSVIVRASIDFGNAVMFCASLSFIGLGAQPPTPEWGAMITMGKDYLRDAWWLVTFPGLAIFLTVMGFNLVGDAIRDYMDPKVN